MNILLGFLSTSNSTCHQHAVNIESEREFCSHCRQYRSRHQFGTNRIGALCKTCAECRVRSTSFYLQDFLLTSSHLEARGRNRRRPSEDDSNDRPSRRPLPPTTYPILPHPQPSHTITDAMMSNERPSRHPSPPTPLPILPRPQRSSRRWPQRQLRSFVHLDL